MEAQPQRAKWEQSGSASVSKTLHERRVRQGLQQKLEEAAQSSVRLCVVAPTVNVSFGEGSLSYKAPLPKDKIQRTLEGQVLPHFATSFVQDGEGEPSLEA